MSSASIPTVRYFIRWFWLFYGGLVGFGDARHHLGYLEQPQPVVVEVGIFYRCLDVAFGSFELFAVVLVEV